MPLQLQLRRFGRVPVTAFVPASSINAYPQMSDAAVGADALLINQLNPGFIPMPKSVKRDLFIPAPALQHPPASSINASPALTDAALGSDSMALAVQLALLDAALGADALIVHPAISSNDSAHGSDSLTETAQIPTSDAGAGHDSLGASAKIVSVDSAVGRDTLFDGAIFDNAQGNDNLTVAQSLALGLDGGGIHVKIVPREEMFLPAQPPKDAAKGRDVVSLAAWVEAKDKARGRGLYQVRRYDPLDDDEMIFALLEAA